MEGIWGVAYVDADKEEDADEGADKDEDKDEDMDSSSQSSHASKFEVKGGVPRIIQVSGAVRPTSRTKIFWREGFPPKLRNTLSHT